MLRSETMRKIPSLETVYIIREKDFNINETRLLRYGYASEEGAKKQANRKTVTRLITLLKRSPDRSGYDWLLKLDIAQEISHLSDLAEEIFGDNVDTTDPDFWHFHRLPTPKEFLEFYHHKHGMNVKMYEVIPIKILIY